MKNNSLSHNQQGMTMLEVLISMTIVLLLWGSVGGFLRYTQGMMSQILSGSSFLKQQQVKQRIEHVLNEPIRKIEGHSNLVRIEKFYEEIVFDLENDNILLLQKSSAGNVDSKKEMILGKVKSVSWHYAYQGEWRDEWLEDFTPEAIELEGRTQDGQAFLFLFPIRVGVLWI